MSSQWFRPSNLDEAYKMAQKIANGRLVPAEYAGNPDMVFSAMIWGGELGIGALEACRQISIVRGKPTIPGRTVIGLVKKHAAYRGHRETVTGEGETMKVVVEMRRLVTVDDDGQELIEAHVGEFSFEDARRGGLAGGGTYTKWPQSMFEWRARSRAIDKAFPDVIQGLPITEIIETAATDDEEKPTKAQEAAADLLDAVAQSEEEADTSAEARIAVAIDRAPEIADAIPGWCLTFLNADADKLTEEQLEKLAEHVESGAVLGWANEHRERGDG